MMQVKPSLQGSWFVLAVLALTLMAPRLAMCQLGTSSSNVGYIDDAIIGTQMKLRFDAAYGNNRPDRAEFFYAKCGCFRELGADPNAPGPAPALNGRDPNTTRFIETNVDYQDINLELEYALSQEFSVFLETPFRFLNPDVNDNTSGFADMQAGFKWALATSSCDCLTFQLRTYIPTGDARRGLGTDHVSLEPALLYYGQIDERMSLEAELRDWIPISGSSGAGTGFDEDFAGNVLRYGVGLAYDVFKCDQCGKRITPVVEVVGWTVLDGLASGSTDGTLAGVFVEDAAGDTIVNLKVGTRVAFNRNDSFYVGYGRALTGDVWYQDIARLEYRRTF
jgi:hypothetical protein